jgi:hypothetical protein
VNEADDMGLRPLLAAVKCNNMAMARLLIYHGAHVHQQNGQRSELHALADTQEGPHPDVRSPHTHTHTSALLLASRSELTCDGVRS